jgi:hypothetical protein
MKKVYFYNYKIFSFSIDIDKTIFIGFEIKNFHGIKAVQFGIMFLIFTIAISELKTK